MQEEHEESVVPVAFSTNNTAPIGSSFPSRFEYVENVQSTELNSGGSQVLSHGAPPKSSSFLLNGQRFSEEIKLPCHASSIVHVSLTPRSPARESSNKDATFSFFLEPCAL